MSKIIFGDKIDLLTAGTPSTDGYIVAYDLDGILKQKDEFGVITPIGGGPTGGIGGTPSLYDVLSINNDTISENIIMGTSTSILSSNGGGQIDLDYSGLSNSVLISTDNGLQNDHGFLMQNGNYSLFANGNDQVLKLENGSGNIALYHSNSGNIQLGVNDTFSTYDVLDEIKISFNGTATASTGDTDKQAVFVGARAATIGPGVINTVVIGGQSLVATQSNFVYVSNLNINNAYTLPSSDGSNNQILTTDGSGNIYWSDVSGGTIGGSGTIDRLARWTPDTSTLSFSQIQDNGTSVAIGTSPLSSFQFHVYSNKEIVIRAQSIANDNVENVAVNARTTGVNTTGINIGVKSRTLNSTTENIAGQFEASGTAPYALQLIDGTEGIGKFLKSITANGKANWADITAVDIDTTGVTASYVLTADGVGNSYWQEPSSGAKNYDMSFAISDETTQIITGTSAITLFAPRSFNITSVKASLSATGSSTTEIGINVNGSQISTLTLNAGESISSGTVSYSITENDEITVDIINAGTGAAGAKIYLIGQTSTLPTGGTNSSIETYNIISSSDIDLYNDGTIRLFWDVSQEDIDMEVLTDPATNQVHITKIKDGITSAYDIQNSDGLVQIEDSMGNDDRIQLTMYAPLDTNYPQYRFEIVKASTLIYGAGTPFFLIIEKINTYSRVV